QPTYMADGDSGVNAEFLLTDAQAVTGYDPFGTVSNAAGLAVSFDPDADWTAGDHVPGYVLRVPEGDRASVESAGRYENGKWTIEFRKPFSGTSNDFEVVPGSSVDFTYEIFDNQGGTHPNDGFDAMVYSLDFSLVTNIESNEKENSPSAFTLSQNYPNPFNPSTTIKFSIPRTSEVSLKVYNMLGQEIAELINMQMSSGNYTVNFNAENLSSGIYFYSIQAGDFSASKKMLLIK
ncbi:MAG: T9SS type A sorting domain-containing protein, partial [Melioribacteraceae bacterium]|nr:T9SS type A sorting domain-containing protein [Melioribacteraceae bacterium]MCF8420668.1 T9SS type A sorting domain-containing protein [Melioribacteraceae bacterium]